MLIYELNCQQDECPHMTVLQTIWTKKHYISLQRKKVFSGLKWEKVERITE